jgi:hypothetical protein
MTLFPPKSAKIRISRQNSTKSHGPKVHAHLEVSGGVVRMTMTETTNQMRVAFMLWHCLGSRMV